MKNMLFLLVHSSNMHGMLLIDQEDIFLYSHY